MKNNDFYGHKPVRSGIWLHTFIKSIQLTKNGLHIKRSRQGREGFKDTVERQSVKKERQGNPEKMSQKARSH